MKPCQNSSTVAMAKYVVDLEEDYAEAVYLILFDPIGDLPPIEIIREFIICAERSLRSEDLELSGLLRLTSNVVIIEVLRGFPEEVRQWLLLTGAALREGKVVLGDLVEYCHYRSNTLWPYVQPSIEREIPEYPWHIELRGSDSHEWNWEGARFESFEPDDIIIHMSLCVGAIEDPETHEREDVTRLEAHLSILDTVLARIFKGVEVERVARFRRTVAAHIPPKSKHRDPSFLRAVKEVICELTHTNDPVYGWASVLALTLPGYPACKCQVRRAYKPIVRKNNCKASEKQ